MNTPCVWQRRGSVELFFYDELDAAARHQMTEHLRVCVDCAHALEELELIRDALAARPEVSAPPAGDWSGFMHRLDTAVVTASARRWKPVSGPVIGLLATAALLTIVTIGVYLAAKQRSLPVTPIAESGIAPATTVATTGLKAAGEDHFERSKLVVLALAAKEPSATTVQDWAYERELASSLLSDTRLYRFAAEQHGLKRLAGVMRDLELVLLETSMAVDSDKNALGNIQRLIEKRGLIEKMDAVSTVGM
jgi:hypothetical protein